MLTNKEAYIEMVKGNKVWIPGSADQLIYRMGRYYTVWKCFSRDGKPVEETTTSFCHLSEHGWEIYKAPITYMNCEEAISEFKKGKKIAHECVYGSCEFNNNKGIALTDRHEHILKIGCIKSEKWFIVD
jgi:hypothetical protein